MHARLTKGKPPGLRLLLQALLKEEDSDIRAIHPAVVQHALEIGLGPVVAHVLGPIGICADHVYAERIQAADLTARILTAEKYHTLTDVLVAADEIDCRVVLLKGAATALRYYPAPHLRTMGDLDILVPADRQAALESRLHALDFRQRSQHPPARFVGRHHSMPFWHHRRNVWIDVHTKLHPRQYPLANAPQFSPETIGAHLLPIAVGNRSAYTLNHELQLIYTCARWAERFDERGIYSILDAALLIRTCGDALNWDRVVTVVRASWAATALRLMLSYLSRSGLACVPHEVLRSVAAVDRHTNAASLRLLHRLIDAHVMERQRVAVALTRAHVNIIWRTIVRPASPFANLLSLPFYLAFPPGHPERFSPRYAIRRLGSFARRALPTRRDRPSTP